MSDRTAIEWCDASWNAITGCSPISAGCAHCYAARMAKRLAGRCGYPAHDPFAVTFHPDRLDQPMRWRKPRRIFVCSMGDLFHADVRTVWISNIWEVMSTSTHHTYMVLTKRPGRMRLYLTARYNRSPVPEHTQLGVTAETQAMAKKRLPTLAGIKAEKRFVSCEPLLGPMDLSRWLPKLHGVIVGAETGPGARPMDLNWARSIRDQCVKAGVPFFFKRASNGSRELDGRRWEQRP